MARYTKEGPRKHKWEIRREEALERKKYWESLTPQQQLENLDRRLGEGVGAVKQRFKIKQQIKNPKLKVDGKKTTKSSNKKKLKKGNK